MYGVNISIMLYGKACLTGVGKWGGGVAGVQVSIKTRFIICERSVTLKTRFNNLRSSVRVSLLSKIFCS